MELADVERLRAEAGGLPQLRAAQPLRLANHCLKYLRRECTYADGSAACGGVDLTEADTLSIPRWVPDKKGPGGEWSQTETFDWSWRRFIASLDDAQIATIFGADPSAPAGGDHGIVSFSFLEMMGVKDPLPNMLGNKFDFVLRQRDVAGVTPQTWALHPDSKGKLRLMTSSSEEERWGRAEGSAHRGMSQMSHFGSWHQTSKSHPK